MTRTEKIANEVYDRHFTPGPWQVHHEVNVTGYPCYFIHGFCGQQKYDAQLHNANAHLIAAAPDMYEALKECEEYFDSRADADHNGERYVGNAEMDFLTMVRATIAKAEGRRP